MKYFASVSYDGSKFYGFQRLEDYDTVQKELERALDIINKNFVAVKGAGRTDRGVHAYSQGVCFELNGSVPTEKLKDVINRLLNNYVHINYVEEVSDDFHPRFDAKKKKYEYVINLGEFDPIINDYVYNYNNKLNIIICNWFSYKFWYRSLDNNKNILISNKSLIRNVYERRTNKSLWYKYNNTQEINYLYGY